MEPLFLDKLDPTRHKVAKRVLESDMDSKEKDHILCGLIKDDDILVEYRIWKTNIEAEERSISVDHFLRELSDGMRTIARDYLDSGNLDELSLLMEAAEEKAQQYFSLWRKDEENFIPMTFLLRLPPGEQDIVRKIVELDLDEQTRQKVLRAILNQDIYMDYEHWLNEKAVVKLSNGGSLINGDPFSGHGSKFFKPFEMTTLSTDEEQQFGWNVPKAAEDASVGSSSFSEVEEDIKEIEDKLVAAGESHSNTNSVCMETPVVKHEQFHDAHVEPISTVASICNTSDTPKLSLPDEMNILLLGETGVGKSTFVNALANYLSYGTMEDAIGGGVKVLIPTTFTVTDDDTNSIKISVPSPYDTEASDAVILPGESVTREPKSYVLKFGNSSGTSNVIRLIDTPGIGDTRGSDQDEVNMNKIIHAITHYDSLHAVCILMKPNESRITPSFRFCLNELLSRIPVSAAKNIVFCFTNGQETLYRPGDSITSLRNHLSSMQFSQRDAIKLNKQTIFCFDNESFRYLCAKNEGTFKSLDYGKFRNSWDRSSKETRNLMSVLCDLEPVEVSKVRELNTVRDCVPVLRRIVSDVINSKSASKKGKNRNTQDKVVLNRLASNICLVQKYLKDTSILLTENIVAKVVNELQQTQPPDFSGNIQKKKDELLAAMDAEQKHKYNVLDTKTIWSKVQQLEAGPDPVAKPEGPNFLNEVEITLNAFVFE